MAIDILGQRQIGEALAPRGGFGWCVEQSIDALGQALAAMADAAQGGEELVNEVATAQFSCFAGGATATILNRIEGSWRAYGSLELPDSLSLWLNHLPAPADITVLAGVGLFVPTRMGSAGVLIDNPGLALDCWPGLRVLAIGLGIVLESVKQRKCNTEALDEINGLQRIANRVLRAGNLDELLSAICRETQRLLSADICGVFLNQQDDIVMRRCIGNRTAILDGIRLKVGQGLAGRVLQTGQHCVVDNYLTSEILSQEFADVVRTERIRSALGAPLRVKEQVIGVLEVWRRRRSTFTEADVRRIITLSSLTAIAINNADLYERQRSVVDQLTLTNRELQKQNEVTRLWADITDEVLSVVVDGGGLDKLAHIVARRTGADTAFLTADLETMAGSREPPWFEDYLPAIQQAIAKSPAQPNSSAVTLLADHRWLSLRSIVAGGDRVGWLCGLSHEQPTHLHDIAIGQAAMACALHYLESRAAARARADALGCILWDLLDGTSHVRQAATIRARELEIDLGGPLRVIHFAADGMTEFDSSQVAPGTSELRLRTILDAFERAFLRQGVLRLMAGRGGRLVALIAVKNDKKIRSILKSIEDDIGREIRSLKMFWGLSAPCDGVGKLQAAHGEAAAALLIARKFKGGKNLALYEELGMVGVLMKVRSDADLGKFVEDTLGRVISHDGKRHDVLIRTLRAYFDCNCEQQAAAKKLLVHEKTVRYRLTQIETLTELDLNSHEDKMLAHLALEMYTTILDRNDEVDGTG